MSYIYTSQNSYPTSKKRFDIKIKIFFCFLLSITGGINQLTYGQDKSVINENTQEIKTYPFSDPNPVPTLAINNKVARFYPYFMFDGYTEESTKKDWNVVNLENSFIDVKVLPQVGGKVWGAIEKSTGNQFIYLNHVLKFRAIGIRGPWTSGGVEHNFGLDLGHAPWTASPVDYILQKNDDGSVSCIVGGLDLASRTQWRVDIRLPKDKAYFETKSLWYNPTPLHDAYLAWENAAYKARNDLQFYYPGNHYIYHSGADFPWPIDKEGHNLAMYKENNFGGNKSYHVMGTYDDWYGGYWHNDEFGFGHWALYSDAPGKKIWIWSLARQGAIWKNLLTDHDGQYIEAQAGVKLNQAGPESGYHSPFNQLSLRPSYSETKTDVWFPVKKTGGMTNASPYGTLNIMLAGEQLKITISPNQIINDTLRVMIDDQSVYTKFLQLKPMHEFEEVVPVAYQGNKKLRVQLGNDKLVYTSDEEVKKLSRPVTSHTKQDFDSAERLFRIAEDENAMREYDKALDDYLACLKKAPTHSRALTRVAELYYRKAQYNKGLKYASKVLENNTYDGGANFIYAALQRKLGHLTKAEEAFSIATRSMEYRSGAYARIAGINIEKKAFDKAIIYAKKALDYNTYNLTAYEFLGTSYRKLKRSKEAEKTFQKLLKVDPLNHYARFEQYLLHPTDDKRSNFNSYIRNEIPQETYLELALEYQTQGLRKEAIQVLEQAPDYPTVYYWLAYLQKNHADKSQKYLKKARDVSPRFVFPFRAETIPVLKWAQKQYPSWKTTYYMGLIYWSKHRDNEAKKLFLANRNKPDFAPFYITRGTLFENDDTENISVGDFKRAVQIDPDGWRSWHYLTSYYLNSGSFQKALGNAKKAYDRFSDNAVIGIDYAKTLYNSQDFDKTTTILAAIKVLPQEGAREGQTIYEEAYLSLAVQSIKQGAYQQALDHLKKSKKWPENLGSGKPYDPDTRLQDYIAAYCEKQLGHAKKAGQLYKNIHSYTLQNGSDQNHGTPSMNAAGIYIGSKVLKDNGQEERANDLISTWKTEQDSLKNWRIAPGSSALPVQWTIAKAKNKKQTAKKLETEIEDDTKRDKFHIFLETQKIISQK